jgi:AraC family transcriptional regulator
MLGCQEVARIAWQTDPGWRPVLTGSSLWVGDWWCRGEQRPWSREATHHVAIELQREGAHVREIGRERCVVDATTVVVQPADLEYRMASPTGHPQRSTVLLLRGDLLDELGDVRAPRVAPLAAATALLLRRLVRARDPVAIEESAVRLAHAALRGPARRRAETRPSWRRIADEVRHLIATRHRERLTLDVLARETRVSMFHLSRAFRAVTGETVHGHLTRVRLRAALYQLDDPAHCIRGAARPGKAGTCHCAPLASVAIAAGFSSHSHFTSAFRAEYGTTPSAIR